MSDTIGELNEKALHAALKAWYAQPGAKFEVPVEGFFIDIVQDSLLIEIQTGSFSSIKSKLRTLVEEHSVRLVYPIPKEKWIVKLARDGSGESSRRKSPKRGKLFEFFWEFVSFPELLMNPNFSLEVLLTQEEDVRRYEGQHRWRKKGWVTEERRLLVVVERHLFETPADVTALLPPDLIEPFSTRDLARALGCRRKLAQKMAYCLRKLGVIETSGKRRQAKLYVRTRK